MIHDHDDSWEFSITRKEETTNKISANHGHVSLMITACAEEEAPQHRDVSSLTLYLLVNVYI